MSAFHETAGPIAGFRSTGSRRLDPDHQLAHTDHNQHNNHTENNHGRTSSRRPRKEVTQP